MSNDEVRFVTLVDGYAAQFRYSISETISQQGPAYVLHFKSWDPPGDVRIVHVFLEQFEKAVREGELSRDLREKLDSELRRGEVHSVGNMLTR
ncbi:MAG: hypothetical protein ACLPH3_24940 [Terracidiphilus sp.]